MTDSTLIELTTLWFVVLIFIQTSTGASGNTLMTVIGLLALLLVYVLPVAILLKLVLRFGGE